MPLEGYFPPIGLNESVFTRDEAERLLKYRAFQQQAVVYVAAPNTPDNLKYMAKYKASSLAANEVVAEAYADGATDVVLLPGNYRWNENVQITTDGVSLSGFGDSTVIDMVGTNNAIYLSGLRARLSRLKIDGTGIGNNLSRAVYVPSGIIEEIYCTNMTDPSNPPTDFTILEGETIINCVVQGGRANYAIKGDRLLFNTVDSHTGIRDIRVNQYGLAIGCKSTGSSATTSAFSSLNEHGRIVNCVVDNYSGPVAIEAAGNRDQIMGNMIRTVDEHGIVLSAASSSCVGNSVFFVSQGTADTYDGIRVEGDNCNVQGNTVREGGVTGSRYGIRIETTADSTFVTNNDLLTAANTPFSDGGTNTVTTAGNRT